MIKFVLILAGLLVLYFILRSRKKTALAETGRLTPQQQEILRTRVDYYDELADEDKRLFERRIADFLQYVRIECVGASLTDTDRVLVASSAVIPVFGFPGWRYQNLTNVLLYPDTFDEEFQFQGGKRNITGMVGTGYMNGQMILSRAALLKGFSSASGKENTAIHEFVHLVDKSDGSTDGVPETVMKYDYSVPWLKLMHGEMRRIQQGKSDINPYALTNEAEFLAVASEYFFEKPGKFKEKHPEIYRQLSEIFDQDPAGTDHK
ncbi:zinc-dependent peptidase [Hufsiella ginkgonis]|uniref:Peptidase n=1 Tax=Hufsiella ginkgonis TaxID=2695274 RepID=A0A7K1XXG2_9SPHI|nr:M90 family metallopeptidase [Hufsiella ginkgonis]MXV15419.1 peptidase [Hufsiella ginkgonis]